MKKLLIFALLPIFMSGCYGGSSTNNKDKSFSQKIAELEKEPVKPTEVTASIYQSDAERAREVEIASQKERRAAAPLVESNYIFQVMPNKGTYGYDEYNQVWTDEPKTEDYKNTKRLWKKPKRLSPDAYNSDSAPAPTEEGAAAAPAAGSDGYSYEEGY